MPNCSECDTQLDFDVEEVDEGDIVACDECGAEFEVVRTEPLELAHVDAEKLDEDDDELMEEEEEEE